MEVVSIDTDYIQWMDPETTRFVQMACQIYRFKYEWDHDIVKIDDADEEETDAEEAEPPDDEVVEPDLADQFEDGGEPVKK